MAFVQTRYISKIYDIFIFITNNGYFRTLDKPALDIPHIGINIELPWHPAWSFVSGSLYIRLPKVHSCRAVSLQTDRRSSQSEVPRSEKEK